MNKQNFTSKFSNILEEEKQNQSRDEWWWNRTEHFGAERER